MTLHDTYRQHARPERYGLPRWLAWLWRWC